MKLHFDESLVEIKYFSQKCCVLLESARTYKRRQHLQMLLDARRRTLNHSVAARREGEKSTKVKAACCFLSDKK